MKKILILLLVISVQTFGQNKKYAERLNTDLTIDSFYHKQGTDSVFAYSNDAFVSFTRDYYLLRDGLEMPNNFGNFQMTAHGYYRDFSLKSQAVHWDGINSKPSTFPATASTVGSNLLALANPASASLINVNTNGTTGTRNLSELRNDLSINNVDNTSDAGKPVSTAQQTALNLKANLASPTFTGTVAGITASMVGLGNVTNESKATMFTSPAFTGTPTGITASHVGLANVNNTSDASKPVSTAQQTALDLKENISTNEGGWSKFVVAGSNATTTGQVLVDVTGLVSGTLLNSTKYEIEVILDVGTSAVTTGTQYGIQTGGTGGAGVVSAIIVGTTTTNAATSATLSAPNAAAGTFLTTSGTSGTITMKGFVTTRGTGTATISIQHLKITSGTSTVRVGSKLRIRLAQ